MHALRRLIRDEMDSRPWNNAELARRSGLSPQLVHDLLTDDREVLADMPKRATLEGLARAFSVSMDVLLTAAARAYGVPVDDVARVADADLLSDEQLIEALRRRLMSVQAPRLHKVPAFPDPDVFTVVAADETKEAAGRDTTESDSR